MSAALSWPASAHGEKTRHTENVQTLARSLPNGRVAAPIDSSVSSQVPSPGRVATIIHGYQPRNRVPLRGEGFESTRQVSTPPRSRGHAVSSVTGISAPPNGRTATVAIGTGCSGSWHHEERIPRQSGGGDTGRSRFWRPERTATPTRSPCSRPTLPRIIRRRSAALASALCDGHPGNDLLQQHGRCCTGRHGGSRTAAVARWRVGASSIYPASSLLKRLGNAVMSGVPSPPILVGGYELAMHVGIERVQRRSNCGDRGNRR